MKTATKAVPSRKEFFAAQNILAARGWEHTMSIMQDDAKKEGVTNFGCVYVKNGQEFYLNFKTIGNLPE